MVTHPISALDVASSAKQILEKLEAADALLTEAASEAQRLELLTMETRFRRFSFALQEEAGWLADYLGPDHAQTVFEVPSAMKSAREFLELLEHAMTEGDRVA